VQAAGDAPPAVTGPQKIVAAVDDWAAKNETTRSDAIRRRHSITNGGHNSNLAAGAFTE
jgi:hypothetical protein